MKAIWRTWRQHSHQEAFSDFWSITVIHDVEKVPLPYNLAASTEQTVNMQECVA
jgi:hypothetical protein